MAQISITDTSVYTNDANKPTDGAKLLVDLQLIIAESNTQDTRITAIESGSLTISGTKTFSGAVTFSSTVTMTGALTQSSTATFSHATGVTTDTITERTPTAGVTVDGVLLKDSYVKTSSAGYTPAVAGEIGYDSTANKYRVRENATNLLIVPNYVKLVDSKTAGTSGGDFDSGAWRTRTLAEETDTGADCVVTSNVFVLTAGTWRINASAPAYAVTQHRARLRNTTDNTTILLGSSEFSYDAASNASTRSVIQGQFTIAASKNLEIQHRCVTTKAATGFGLSANLDGENEIYTLVELWRVA